MGQSWHRGVGFGGDVVRTAGIRSKVGEMKHAALALLIAAGAVEAGVIAIATHEDIRLELHDAQGP